MLNLNSERSRYLLVASNFVIIVGPFDAILLMRRPTSPPPPQVDTSIVLVGWSNIFGYRNALGTSSV